MEEPVADELSDETVRGLHADAVRLTRSNLVSAVLVWLLTLGLTAFTAVSFKSFFTMAVLAAGAASVHLVAVAKTWAALQRVDPQHFVRRETETHQRLREERNAHRLRWIATTPVATRTLMIVIGVLTAMQFVVLGLDERPSLRAAALVKSAVQQGEYWRMLSAGFLHLGAVHALGNLIGLMLLGRLIEAYARPLFVPLIFLVAVLYGSIASMLAHDATSVGASGGVMGLVGFLLALTLRPSSETPEFIRSAVLASIGAIALIGLAGWKYVDNAGHAGGALAGLLIGLVFVPRRGGPITPRRAAWIDALGWIAAAVLAAGAVFTAVKLIQMRLHR